MPNRIGGQKDTGVVMNALITLIVSLQLAPAPFALDYAPAPGSPPNIIALSAVVLTADVNRQGIPSNIQVISGGPPFVTSAVSSVTGWRFRNDTRLNRLVSVTFLFRPATIYPGNPVSFPPRGSGRDLTRDSPPIPVVVTDPGYPPASIAQGPVVLQIDVSRSGIPEQIREIGDTGTLGDVAMNAVRQWRFQPALRDGRNIEGTAIAVIGFLRPVTE